MSNNVAALSAATKTVREYSGSDVSGVVVAMLDALIDGYRVDLEEVSADNLKTLQAALKQVILLRNVMIDIGVDVPKI